MNPFNAHLPQTTQSLEKLVSPPDRLLYMQGPNNMHEYTGLRFGDADPYKSGNERTGGDTPGPLFDSGLDYRVLCDGFIYGQVLTHPVHVIVKGLNISRTWLY